MDFLARIFTRMDLQQISSFLLDGVECLDTENRTYMERLNAGSASIYKRLEQLYPDASELDMAVVDLSEALSAYQAVYMEIGMRSGAKLIHQLLHANESIGLDSAGQT